MSMALTGTARFLTLRLAIPPPTTNTTTAAFFASFSPPITALRDISTRAFCTSTGGPIRKQLDGRGESTGERSAELGQPRGSQLRPLRSAVLLWFS